MDFVDVREFVSLVCEASGTSSDLAMKLVKAINRKLPDGYTVECESALKFIVICNDKVVGEFERKLDAGFIRHIGFWFDQKHRGKGIGSIIFNASASVYKKAGIKGIRIDAQSGQVVGGKANGAYTWARLGVDWKDEKERRRVKDLFMGFLLRMLLKRARIAPSKQMIWWRENEKLLAAEALKATKTPKTLTTYMYNDIEVGKQFLLSDVEWRGVMRF